jgi:hypothetical protein
MIPDNRGKKYKRTVTDPRVHLFKKNYIDPKSETFMNIFQSAMKAGYSEQYAANISVQRPKWWLEFTEQSDVRRARMLNKAEQGLEKVLDYDDNDRDKASMKLKAATYVTERLGKEHYSSRQEVTGADGRRLFDSSKRESATVPLTKLFKGVAKD